MDDNIVEFSGLTTHDLEPDKVLEGAKGRLKQVVVIGWKEDDGFYFSGSSSDMPKVLWLLELAKRDTIRSGITEE